MTPELKNRRFQFSLASLLVVQAVASLLLGIGKGFGWAAMVSIVMLTTMFTLIAVGTVWIAAEWDRSVQFAKVIARIALVALAIVILASVTRWGF